MHTPLRIAFVGAGQMARSHLDSLRRVPTPHVVVGVADVSPDAARALAETAGAVAFTDVTEMCRSVKPDIVHVCTPAGMHVEPARAALESGAHVYVEKPFTETRQEADDLLTLAESRGLLVCAGHQQLRDPAYVRLLGRVPELGRVTQVDCDFAFRAPKLNLDEAGPAALARQLLDVLPHPLYTLLATLERTGAQPSSTEIRAVAADPADLHVLFQAGGVTGRLAISLRVRPVGATLSVSGALGRLTADFIRTSVVGAANSGEGPLEKVANPIVESWQMATRTAAGIARRVVQGGGYPGLAELIGDFYAAVARGGSSPISPEHLRLVTTCYEELAASVRAAAATQSVLRPVPDTPPADAPLVAVTGARGFFGRAITRTLAAQGFRVRGIGRTIDAEDPNVHEWRMADLGRGASAELFRGAVAVVHAAAETAGSFDAHQRNSIDASRNVVRAMAAADVRRLVYVSTLSVIRPPRTPWETQDEATPLLAPGTRALGAYAWGKTEAERVVVAESAAGGVATRIVRPGALIDLAHPEIPGLVGRQLFGRWHLGFGRPGLPFAAIDVGEAAAAIAWCVREFDAAPAVVNLFDPRIPTRGSMLAKFRDAGWRGRMFWMPIPMFAATFTTARLGLALPKLRLPPRMAVWSIFRPRRYDATITAEVTRAARRPAAGHTVTVP